MSFLFEVLRSFFSTDVADDSHHSEAWRYGGIFSRGNRFGRAFPGLGIASIAFALYCGIEYVFFPGEQHHGGPAQLDAHGPSLAQTG